MDFSKLETGQLDLVPRPFEVVPFFEGNLALVEMSAHDKGLELSLEIEAGVRDVLVFDDGRRRQVLFNLVGNAIKFTASGPVSLRVGYQPARRRLDVAVVDTGEGIPEDKFARLFQRFSRSTAP